ncbi:hypothetical protein BP6252_00418 [Coleophoma cylindrospora]|uniref:Uncharacterized protein n=1 Tax=Coleophoma cylindrospora TaxID=1849047 RepID=A0A3D8SPZ9_9HELO|nr:hypothetical protein BP6252_00418 [Coleophoma cylindrospora]
MSTFQKKLDNQNIAVVGGSSGIGFGAAQALLESGANVTIVSSSPHKVDDAKSRLKASVQDGRTLQGAVGDVRDEAGFVALLQSLAPLDHLVFSSVDKIIRGPLASLELADAQHLFGVKFWGAVTVGKAVLKHDIIRAGGSLVLTSGMAAVKPGKNAAVGGALNAGVITFTKGLACELAEKKIRVNTVVPGMVKTELWDKLGKSKEQQRSEYEDLSQKLPVGFVADPMDIAEAWWHGTVRRYGGMKYGGV